MNINHDQEYVKDEQMFCQTKSFYFTCHSPGHVDILFAGKVLRAVKLHLPRAYIHASFPHVLLNKTASSKVFEYCYCLIGAEK